MKQNGMKRVIPGVLGALLIAGGVFAREAHWIEGEDFATSTFNQHSWYQNTNISKDLLSPGTGGVSDGEWHAHYSNSGNETATATYSFETAEPGPYACWIRLNPFRNANGGGNYSISMDGGAFQPIDTSTSQSPLDLVDPGIDIRFIDWVAAGSFDLAPGTHTLRVRLTRRPGDSDNHGGIDVLALVNFPWAPAGTLPPDPTPPTPEPDEWFPLQAGPDAFSEDSIIDMSDLIERPAGLHGPLKRNGSRFEFADGTPVKFWGAGAAMLDSEAAQTAHARFLAKYGVNMVRLHPVEGELGVLRKNASTGERYLDPAALDRLDRWFAIFKDQGIYMTWSLFYPHVISPDDGYPADLYAELPDKGAGKSSSGMVAFMPQLQEAEWEWARTLLSHVNPYTGLAYKDDPALAIVEVHNEDSIFWHAPLNQLADGSFPRHAAELQSLWQQWVKQRYGTDDQLREAWGAGMKPDDSVDNPRMGIYGAWEMEADGPFSRKEEERKRMGDFIRFLAETQRAYYERRGRQLRDLGFQGVLVTTAWKAGGPAADPANLWTDDALDAIDRHNYFGGGAGNHSIVAGSVNNASHLDQPGRGILSSGLYQVEDKPFIMTEWTQKPPNQWKAEIAPLVAFYGMGLQGWDASYHFNSSRSFLGNGWPSLSSYVTGTPHYIGQFPALAFAIYHNHFQEAEIAAARRIKTDELFQGIDPLSQDFSGGGYDENEPAGNLETPTEVLAVGRITVAFGDDVAPSHAIDWNEFWNTTDQTVTSTTGQLTWDYKRRVVLARSEKTQGIVGFAGGHSYSLPGATVDVTTPLVSLLFTPLDNRPLASSGHILITALARDIQTGTVYNADGTQLLEVGGPPLLLEPVQAEITLKGPQIDQVKVVDVYGVPGERELPLDGNTFTIDGRYATYYYEIKRNVPELSVSVENSDVILEWEDPAGNLILQETSALNQAWNNSSRPIDIENGHARTTIEAIGSQSYFRLFVVN